MRPSTAPATSEAVPSFLRLNSNENPYGPSPAALEALRSRIGAEVARYPDDEAELLQDAIARNLGIASANVLLGCGSTEILKISVAAFTSPSRGLVTASPSFEDPVRYAEAIGSPVERLRVTESLSLDLGAMAENARGAGLVYLCNPNNPTAGIVSGAAVRDFIQRLSKESPATTILVDEAYFEYVDDGAYATAIPLALESPRVVVSRTFSKIHGMAGLRAGYAVAKEESIAAMRRHRLMDSVNALGAIAAAASMTSPGASRHLTEQRRLNSEARTFTSAWFEKSGFRVFPSQANFLMADIRRDTASFRDACRAQGVGVGRPFPPLLTHARVSIGTMEEMRRAVEVFARLLGRA